MIPPNVPNTHHTKIRGRARIKQSAGTLKLAWASTGPVAQLLILLMLRRQSGACRSFAYSPNVKVSENRRHGLPERGPREGISTHIANRVATLRDA